MSKLFSTDMTSAELSKAFFKVTDGMTKEEYRQLFEKEYRPVAKIIHDREFELGQQGWMLGN